MKYLPYILLLFLTLSTWMASPLLAQKSSELDIALSKAKIQFDRGNFTEAIDLLEEVLEKKRKSYKRKDKAKADLLLAEIYLVQRKTVQADSCMIEALKADKGLSISPIQQPDLYHLYRTFRSDPVYFFSIRGGGNISSIIPFDNYGTGNTRTQQSNYPINPLDQSGIMVGLGYSFAMYRNVEMGLEVNYGTKTYKFEDRLNTGSNTLPAATSPFLNPNTNVNSLTYTESQSWLDIPVLFTYTWRKPSKVQKFFPFAYAGMSYNYLASARFISIKREAELGPTRDPFLIENNLYNLLTPKKGAAAATNRLPLRARHNFSTVMGIGVKVKLGINYLGLDFRHNSGLKNLVNTDNRLSNRELIHKFGYVDDDIRMVNYSLSLSFIRPIYFPKKKNAYVLPPIYPKPLYGPIAVSDTQLVDPYTQEFYEYDPKRDYSDRNKAKAGPDKNIPFRDPTDEEIRRVVRQDALLVIKAGMDFMLAQDDQSKIRLVKGELIDLINQELKRLEAERKALRKELRAGPQKEIELEMEELETLADQLEQSKREVLKNHKAIIEKNNSKNKP